MTRTQVYCKDCKHYEAFRRINAEVCLSPKLPIDLVSGEPKFALCKDQRYQENKAVFKGAQVAIETFCGAEGKWFEPKITEAADLDDLSTIPFGK